MCQDNRQELLESLHRKAVFFTGAGISFSAPASLPLGKQISDNIIELMIDEFEIKYSLGHEFPHEWIKSAGNIIPMELLWEILIRVLGDRALAALNILSGGQPNEDHKAIALACEIFNVDTIFTLNFDLLQEEAISKYTGLVCRSIVKGTDFEDFQRKSKTLTNTIWVIHLHDVIGERNYDNLATTISKVGTSLPRYKKLPFADAVLGKDIICAGYSNGDIDAFPILAANGRKLLWYLYSGVLPDQVQILKNAGKVSVIPKDDSEHGFADLLASIAPILKLRLESSSSERTTRTRGRPKQCAETADT